MKNVRPSGRWILFYFSFIAVSFGSLVPKNKKKWKMFLMLDGLQPNLS
jgi:hypothetical protein